MSTISDTICPLLITRNDDDFIHFPRTNIPRRLTLSRTRAFVACVVCRSRKVRCNVAEIGPPCTNCRLDKIPCDVAKTNRKRDGRTFCPPAIVPYLSDGESRHGEIREVLARPGQPPDLPHYIRPGCSRLNTDVVQFLARKGAFAIPPVALRNQLLTAYAEFAHRHLPFINMAKIINDIDRRERGVSTSGTSLLLFQAIMASGSVAVSMRHLKAAGYASRQEASAELFCRVRCLYDLDYESDRVAIIQSLTLMCYWFQTPDWKDRYHWLTVAISLSYTLNLQHGAACTNTSSLLFTFHKRLWWCLYTADKIISATLHRAGLINAGDFTIPMLTLSDFDPQLVSEGTSSSLAKDCAILRDASQQHQMAVLFIEKAKLSVCVDRILTSIYSVRGMSLIRCCDSLQSQAETCGSWRSHLIPRSLEQLISWKQGLNAEARYTGSNTASKCVFVHRCHLHLIYLTTLRELYQAQHSNVEGDCSHCIWQNDTFPMIEAAMASIGKQLDAAGVTNCLPPSGMTTSV